MVKSVICIVGPIAAGKGTLVEILKEMGYVPYSFSDRIKEEIKNRGQEVTRFTLNEISNELRKNIGPDVWARRNADVIDRENPELVVIDGARNPHEIEFLKSKYDARVMGIDADQKTRYERLKHRGLMNEDITFDQFKELDDRELAQTGEYAQQVGECLKLANIIIENNGTIEELREKVREFVSSLN